MWTSKSNMAIMEELGSRLKEYRIRKNLQQKELALNAGVGLDTIVRLECGSSISTEKFIRILRVPRKLPPKESWNV